MPRPGGDVATNGEAVRVFAQTSNGQEHGQFKASDIYGRHSL